MVFLSCQNHVSSIMRASAKVSVSCSDSRIDPLRKRIQQEVSALELSKNKVSSQDPEQGNVNGSDRLVR